MGYEQEVSSTRDQLETLAPALAFLLAAVPLAHLLGRLGFFDAVARRVAHRFAGVWAWWLLAAVTTVVLNLDTTVVLLTPLFLHIARRRGDDPMVLAVVPFLLANLASSVLPVSNLTNLIAAERVGITTAELARGLGPATVAMVAVGFVAHRRWAAWRAGWHPAPGEPVEVEPEAAPDDRRALVLGGVVVGGLLLAFVVGPLVGIVPWMAVVVADLVLAVALRWFPVRSVPVTIAAAVAVVAVLVDLLVPGERLAALVDHPGAGGALLGALTAAALTSVVDNLPALLAMLPAVDHATVMPVLLGVNAGAVLTPIGSLANLLWLRNARAHGLEVGWRDALQVGWLVGAPAFVAGVVVLVAQRALTG
jgi:arsenical pump membrane protein